MKRMLSVASFLFVLLHFGRGVENLLKEDDVYICYQKIICDMNKIDEIYAIMESVGPEVGKNVLSFVEDVCQVNIPENTMDYWYQYKDAACAWPEEKKRDNFNKFGGKAGEYMMEVCMDAEADVCKLIQYGFDQFNVLLGKYTAMGVCQPTDFAPSGEALSKGKESVFG